MTALAYTPYLSQAIEATKDMDIDTIADAIRLGVDRVGRHYNILDEDGDIIAQLRSSEVRGWLVRQYAVSKQVTLSRL